MPPTGSSGGGGGSAPLDYLPYNTPSQGQGQSAANQTFVQGFLLPYKLTFSHIGIHVDQLDAVNNYDFGIYNTAGTLLANVGAAIYASTGFKQLATIQGAQTLQPGRYVFGWTGNGNTLTIDYNTLLICWMINANIVASVGGVMPASIGAVSFAEAQAGYVFSLH